MRASTESTRVSSARLLSVVLNTMPDKDIFQHTDELTRDIKDKVGVNIITYPYRLRDVSIWQIQDPKSDIILLGLTRAR